MDFLSDTHGVARQSQQQGVCSFHGNREGKHDYLSIDGEPEDRNVFRVTWQVVEKEAFIYRMCPVSSEFYQGSLWLDLSTPSLDSLDFTSQIKHHWFRLTCFSKLLLLFHFFFP